MQSFAVLFRLKKYELMQIKKKRTKSWASFRHSSTLLGNVGHNALNTHNNLIIMLNSHLIYMYNIKTFVLQQQNSKLKRTQLRRKVHIKESEFLHNMHIYTLCSKYFQTFMKFYSVVKAMNAMKTRLFL